MVLELDMDRPWYDVDQQADAIARARQRLLDRGWTLYKVASLCSPDQQLLVRTGYSSGEFYLEVRRWSQERANRHVTSVDPYEPVAYLRLHPRMDNLPDAAIGLVLSESGALR
jgi:hypothetical protein